MTVTVEACYVDREVSKEHSLPYGAGDKRSSRVNLFIEDMSRCSLRTSSLHNQDLVRSDPYQRPNKL